MKVSGTARLEWFLQVESERHTILKSWVSTARFACEFTWLCKNYSSRVVPDTFIIFYHIYKHKMHKLSCTTRLKWMLLNSKWISFNSWFTMLSWHFFTLHRKSLFDSLSITITTRGVIKFQEKHANNNKILNFWKMFIFLWGGPRPLIRL